MSKTEEQRKQDIKDQNMTPTAHKQHIIDVVAPAIIRLIETAAADGRVLSIKQKQKARVLPKEEVAEGMPKVKRAPVLVATIVIDVSKQQAETERIAAAKKEKEGAARSAG